MHKVLNHPICQLGLIMCFSTFLSTANASELTPFEASYSIEWQGGISFSGNAIRKLSKHNDSWRLETSASSTFASLKESSEFTYSDQLTPINYRFKRKVLGRSRNAKLDFDWATQQVTNDVQGQPWKMPIHPGVLDKLNVQLQLRLDIADGKKDFNYTVADGGHLKQYKFMIDGEERLNTPFGEYQTVRIKRIREPGNERQTSIWFAPELDYLMVQIHQKEKKNKSYKLTLKQLKQ